MAASPKSTETKGKISHLTMKALSERFEQIEQEIQEVRDVARDARHLLIGIDGNNGLRGNLKNLDVSVEKMKEDFLFLRETAHNYRELKTLILRFLFTGSFAFLFQLGGVVWFFSADHKSNETLTLQIRDMAADLKQMQKENMARDITEAATIDKLKNQEKQNAK